MKKIYTITLDDEIPLSESVSSDIREIAYFLFEEIAKYDREILAVEDKKENLIKNELLESFVNSRYNYRFESEHSNIENYRYEPFLINDRSFGFTVYDGTISEEEIMHLLKTTLAFLKLNYTFNIDSVYYDDQHVSGRLSAYSFLKSGYVRHDGVEKIKKKTKTLAKPLLSMFNF